MLNRTTHVLATPATTFGCGDQAWATPFSGADAGMRSPGRGA